MRFAVLFSLLSVCLWLTAVVSDAAEPVQFSGTKMAGGLLIGKATPGSRVLHHGKAVRVAEDGFFLIGFGRNAKTRQTVEVHAPDGSISSHDITLKNRAYKITRIDGLPARKVSPKPEDLKRIRQDNAGISQVRKRDSQTQGFLSGFQWPVSGRISGVFGSQRVLNGKARNPHNGVDIAAPAGTPVHATATGTVALVHPDMFFSGKTVMIDHGHGLSSVYIHMSKITVSDGQHVTKGDKIGEVGMTGRATGPHLHWGISLFSTHLDPMLLVTGRTDIAQAQ